MKVSWNNIADDVQDYIACGITPLPFVYYKFLQKLVELEYVNKLCLLHHTRLEVFHVNLESKVLARVKSQEYRKPAR